MPRRYERDEESKVVRVDWLSSVERSPRFEEYWNKHRRLIWWCARRAARTFGGQAEDYIGFLVIRLHKALKSYDEAKSKFTTYYCSNLFRDIACFALRFDSELASLRYALRNTDPDSIRLIHDTHKAEEVFYHIPDKEHDWIMEIRKCFKCDSDLWRFLCRGLSPRDAEIMWWRYKYGETLEAISHRYGVTKARIQQIVVRCLDHMKERIGTLDRWVKLFKVQDEELADIHFDDMKFGEGGGFFGEPDWREECPESRAAV